MEFGLTLLNKNKKNNDLLRAIKNIRLDYSSKELEGLNLEETEERDS
jgi:hypothetical protein